MEQSPNLFEQFQELPRAERRRILKRYAKQSAAEAKKQARLERQARLKKPKRERPARPPLSERKKKRFEARTNQHPLVVLEGNWGISRALYRYLLGQATRPAPTHKREMERRVRQALRRQQRLSVAA